ncbi:MAG: universal stress protein [Actinobacteria bacterium]|nr:universal stress protein [Actinomycetota bacterium]
MGTDIVVGIDGSEDSKRALAWAAEEAALRGCRVKAVLCWSYLGLTGTDMGVGTTEADARAAIEETVAAALDEEGRAVVDVTPVNDLPVAGLLDQAAQAELVVVGSRGRGGVKGLVLGSVSRTIVERSPVPVVVLPHHA